MHAGPASAAPLRQADGKGSAAILGCPSLARVDKVGNLYASDQSQTYSDVYTIRLRLTVPH